MIGIGLMRIERRDVIKALIWEMEEVKKRYRITGGNAALLRKRIRAYETLIRILKEEHKTNDQNQKTT